MSSQCNDVFYIQTSFSEERYNKIKYYVYIIFTKLFVSYKAWFPPGDYREIM